MNYSQIDRLMRVAHKAGAKVESASGSVDMHGRTYVLATIYTKDNTHAVKLLNALAEDDAKEDKKIVELGRLFRENSASKKESIETLAKRIHQYVQSNIQFAPEEGEKFRLASLTLEMGSGDCDDSSHLLMSLSIASGIPARIVLVKNSKGEESHVAAQMWVDNKWQWAETTFPALFGESPHEAAQRLGLMRSDVV